MNPNIYMPEGCLYETEKNRSYIGCLQGLERAMREQVILEAPALLCDEGRNLHVGLCVGTKAVIPREEVLSLLPGELGKDIAYLTRVGKKVCFKVTEIDDSVYPVSVKLSRRAAQEECRAAYIDRLEPGDLVHARVTHTESFGAFCDIGCGIVSLMPVDAISVSRISSPADRLRNGMQIQAVVRTKDAESGRIYLSMRELLGTWEENAGRFRAGQTVSGVIRSVESYGIFIELTPNLAGLAEVRDRETDLAAVGHIAAVYIKSINPERMKIKLALVDSYKGMTAASPLHYYISLPSVSHLDRWVYSPVDARRTVETVFTPLGEKI